MLRAEILGWGWDWARKLYHMVSQTYYPFTLNERNMQKDLVYHPVLVYKSPVTNTTNHEHL